jgi:hypothetical protein
MVVAIAFGIIAKAGTAGHDEQELEKALVQTVCAPIFGASNRLKAV